MKKTTAVLEKGTLILESGRYRRLIPGVCSIRSEAYDNGGLWKPCVRTQAQTEQGTVAFFQWEGLPMVEMAGFACVTDTVEAEHITLRVIRFANWTDRQDTLIRPAEYHLFAGNIPAADGHIFFLDDIRTGMTTVYLVSAPDLVLPQLTVKKYQLTLENHGYPVAVGRCETEQAERLCRDWYRCHWLAQGLHTMSNTWGDANSRSRVERDFIRREITSAAELGLDIVQIDDGWQTGVPNKWDENHLRLLEGDFWELNTDRFPDGLLPLARETEKKGMRLGLWFAPHSRNCFEHYDRDVAVLKKAYKEWGIRYFKLDMLQLLTDAHCEKFHELLKTVCGFGKDVSVELDVTADARLGYLACAPYGTVFVENRYTKTANSFPHRVLRNLWQLCRYVPSGKLQMELVNPDLYRENYAPDDPFRPELYDMDYLFAQVMFSNPLVWMETQFVSPERREQLQRLIPVWRKNRELLRFADVQPLGEKPCGRALTGFLAENGEDVQLLLLREVTARDTMTVPVCLTDVQLLASNTEAGFRVQDGAVTVTFGKERSYVWLKGRRIR